MSDESTEELSKKIIYATQNEDSVVIHYQPIYNNRTNKIEKYEVLMRLDIKGEIIFPNDFLPLAKQIKKYKELSKIVIEKAFRFFSENDFEFCINLSMIDIEDLEFQDFFYKKLKEYKVHSRLTIEIVESEEIHRTKEFYTFIEKVKLLKCKIAVDDFGIGYSNLAYILDMSDHIDYIKFDGSLIKNIVDNSKVQLFIGNLKFLCDNMQVLTIAEYVENKEIMKYIKSIGIDYSQGYHIGMPKSKI